jgi:hypothetical protein
MLSKLALMLSMSRVHRDSLARAIHILAKSNEIAEIAK